MIAPLVFAGVMVFHVFGAVRVAPTVRTPAVQVQPTPIRQTTPWTGPTRHIPIHP